MKLQPCSLSDGLISRAKSLRCMEGKQACGLGQRANRQTSDSIAHIVAGMNKKAITVFSGLNTVLPCILTTCSTSREISHVMIISIALRDYLDHCLKSLNCNSTRQSSAAGKKTIPSDMVKFTCCLLYNLESWCVFVFICLSFSDVNSKLESNISQQTHDLRFKGLIKSKSKVIKPENTCFLWNKASKKDAINVQMSLSLSLFFF